MNVFWDHLSNSSILFDFRHFETDIFGDMEDHFKGHFSNHFARHSGAMGGDFDFNSIFDEDLFGKSQFIVCSTG